MSWFSDAVGSIASSLFDELPPEITGAFEGLPEITPPDIGFTGFGVTAPGVGGVTVDPTGGATLGISPEQQALQDQLFGGAGSFFTRATGDTAQREADIYDKIRAMQRPEEERSRMMLEERLANQGRLGVRTGMFGGTPEAFAMEKAIAEANNAAALSAIEQAIAEQAQDAALGQSFMQTGYAPSANLLNLLGAATNTASLADVARRQQGEYDLKTQIANLEGQLGGKQALANLYGSLFGQALQGVSGLAAGATEGLFDKILDKI